MDDVEKMQHALDVWQSKQYELTIMRDAVHADLGKEGERTEERYIFARRMMEALKADTSTTANADCRISASAI